MKLDCVFEITQMMIGEAKVAKASAFCVFVPDLSGFIQSHLEVIPGYFKITAFKGFFSKVITVQPICYGSLFGFSMFTFTSWACLEKRK